MKSGLASKSDIRETVVTSNQTLTAALTRSTETHGVAEHSRSLSVMKDRLLGALPPQLLPFPARAHGTHTSTRRCGCPDSLRRFYWRYCSVPRGGHWVQTSYGGAMPRYSFCASRLKMKERPCGMVSVHETPTLAQLKGYFCYAHLLAT